jgi:hypothetical protein
MAKAHWHLSQLNVGRIVAPTDSPIVADFMNALDHIKALAEASPGFVWRLQGDNGNATEIVTTPDPYFLINMSVWESIETLFEFVYRSIPASWGGGVNGSSGRPRLSSVVVGTSGLSSVTTGSASASRTSFKQHFPPPHEPLVPPSDMKPEPYCVGWV